MFQSQVGVELPPGYCGGESFEKNQVKVVSELIAASAERPATIAALEASQRQFVLADSLGNVVQVNEAFCQVYGWQDHEIVGEPIGKILPESFRMAHQFGFSRFQATEQSTILAHPLRLNTLCADGRSLVSEHFIVAEKRSEGWVFGATLTPLPEGTPVDA